ncbi:uncharacterized protein LOC116944931 [Petromyzon marinus]|uniref:uncharacterized protein LOC116944931 n=1 Tax=Petromyzon marinus TaxID=7757 RepID=UPI003F6FC6D6
MASRYGRTYSRKQQSPGAPSRFDELLGSKTSPEAGGWRERALDAFTDDETSTPSAATALATAVPAKRRRLDSGDSDSCEASVAEAACRPKSRRGRGGGQPAATGGAAASAAAAAATPTASGRGKAEQKHEAKVPGRGRGAGVHAAKAAAAPCGSKAERGGAGGGVQAAKPSGEARLKPQPKAAEPSNGGTQGAGDNPGARKNSRFSCMKDIFDSDEENENQNGLLSWTDKYPKALSGKGKLWHAGKGITVDAKKDESPIEKDRPVDDVEMTDELALEPDSQTVTEQKPPAISHERPSKTLDHTKNQFDAARQEKDSSCNHVSVALKSTNVPEHNATNSTRCKVSKLEAEQNLADGEAETNLSSESKGTAKRGKESSNTSQTNLKEPPEKLSKKPHAGELVKTVTKGTKGSNDKGSTAGKRKPKPDNFAQGANADTEKAPAASSAPPKAAETAVEPDEDLSFRASSCRTYSRPGRKSDSPVDGLLGDSKLPPQSQKDLTWNPQVEVAFPKACASRDPITLPNSFFSPTGVTLQEVGEPPKPSTATAPPVVAVDSALAVRKASAGAAGSGAGGPASVRGGCAAAGGARRPSGRGGSSSKRQAKLEMFGFEDDSDGEEGGSSEGAAPCAAYKIKYFGFDEMVEEEGEDIPAVEVKARGGAGDWWCSSTDATGEASSTVATSQDSLQSSQESTTSRDTDILESGSEEGAWSACSRSGSIAKHNAERKNEDGKKLIFHSPKKPLGKAVYNARHWNHPEEEMKAPRLDRASSAPASVGREREREREKEHERGERKVLGELESRREGDARPGKDGERRADAASPEGSTRRGEEKQHPAEVTAAQGNAEQEGTAPSGETEQGERSVFKEPPPPPPARLRRIACPSQDSDEGVSSLKCHKEDKELYTVVRQVKHFNEVLEFGETQEYTDDVEYLMSGLKPRQPLSTRCLSVISLAMKCAMPGFRMHLRAHGQVAKVFKLLIDAQENQNLALCTAALMYVLSRDRLNMDLDRGCLELLIRLLEMEGGGAGGTAEEDAGGRKGAVVGAGGAAAARAADIREGDRLRERIRKLCEKVHNRHLDLENMTTGHLAMETLLSLTSRRAGDWFKEELRLLGGLDHIVDKVADCAEKLRSADRGAEEKLVDSLRGAERCLRVLESVTVHNPENQGYLIAYQDSQLIVSTARVLGLCEVLLLRKERAETRNEEGTVNNAGAEWSPLLKALEGCLRASFGVLLNLTHDNEWGSTKAGEQDRLVGSVLGCVLHVPSLLPAEQRFDIRVLGLALLVNLVELSARNRQCLVAMETEGVSADSSCIADTGPGCCVPALEALVQLYLQREHAAQLAETQTDDIIKGAMKTAASSQPGGAAAPAAEGATTSSASLPSSTTTATTQQEQQQQLELLQQQQQQTQQQKQQHRGSDPDGEWHESESGLEWVEASPEPGRTGRPGDIRSAKQAAAAAEEEEMDTLKKALAQAGKHMEDCIVASYTALVLGCLCHESPTTVQTIRECLPKGDFSSMTEMLQKFLCFMNLTSTVGTTGQKSIARVIECLERC